MQVSIQSNGLERRLTVELPAQAVENEVLRRLRSLAQRVRMDGFRPGKIPFKVVEQRYGRQVRDEVASELVQSSFSEAAAKERLRVAGSPEIELLNREPGTGLQYTAKFEVYPEFQVNIPAQLQVEKPVVEIAEDDVDKMIDRLRSQRMRFAPVERAAQDGDRLTIDFKGYLNGEAFAGGEGEGYPLVLGSKAFIPGFEDQLIGAKAGEDRIVEVDFPANYPAAELAGQRARFEVRVQAVAGSELPEVDDALAQSFGVKDGGVESLRDEVRTTMGREIGRLIKDKVKAQVMDALIASNPIELPRALIDQEIVRLMEQVEQSVGQLRARELAAQPGYYEERARRRVALGLIIAEVIRANQLHTTPDKLRAAVEDLAATYESPAEVIQWYYSSRDRLNGVEAMLLEDQAVARILANAEMKDVSMSYESLVATEQVIP